MRKKFLVLCLTAAIFGMLTGCSSQNGSETKETTAATEAMTAAATETQSETATQKITESSEVMSEASAVKTLEKQDITAEQAQINEALKEEVKKGYTLEEPLIIVNPYGNSPLTAVAIFSTEKKTGVKVVVHGKEAEDDVTGSFEAETDHILPIYGLYSGEATEVTFELEDGTSYTAKVETDAIETTMMKTEVTTMDTSVYDFSKMTFASCASENKVVAYDSTGAMRWYFETSGLPFKQLANGHFITLTPYLIHPLYYMSGIVEMDLLGKVYKEYELPGGSHHAIYEMSNGNLLVGSSTTDFSKVEDRIVELDRETGEVVFELQMADLLDPTDGGSVNRSEKDWFHNNAIWYDEGTDTILLSARHVDAIVAVDKAKKELKWILGDPEGWTKTDKKYFFTPEGENFEWQYAQHNVTMLPDGRILLFDNGDARTKATKPENESKGDNVYSRAVVYKIDTDKMTISQDWEYGKERGPEWFSSFISGADYLSENNYWLTSGSTMYDPEKKTYDLTPYSQLDPSIEKTTHINQVKDNKLVYELKVSSLIYRSIRASMYAETNQSLNLEEQGKWLGSLGETKTTELTADTSKAEPMDPAWVLNQKTFGLLFTGSVKLDDIKKAVPAYLILQDKDGAQKAYEMYQMPIPAEDGSGTLSLSQTVSADGLEGNTYHVYIQAQDKVYDSGYEVQF